MVFSNFLTFQCYYLNLYTIFCTICFLYCFLNHSITSDVTFVFICSVPVFYISIYAKELMKSRSNIKSVFHQFPFSSYSVLLFTQSRTESGMSEPASAPAWSFPAQKPVPHTVPLLPFSDNARPRMQFSYPFSIDPVCVHTMFSKVMPIFSGCRNKELSYRIRTRWPIPAITVIS